LEQGFTYIIEFFESSIIIKESVESDSINISHVNLNLLAYEIHNIQIRRGERGGGDEFFGYVVVNLFSNTGPVISSKYGGIGGFLGVENGL